jgi:F0F1-type ATP synthase membrane subunit a
MLNLLAAGPDPLEHVLPHPIFGHHITWFTNQSLMALVAALLMLMIFPRLFSRAESSAPTGAKNFFEAILEFLRVEVFRPALKENTDKYVPFLWTMFFFILFCNVLGCIPFPDIFLLLSGGRLEHIGGTATSSINTTATLAICAFFFIHFNGLDTIARSLMDGTYGHQGHHNDKHIDGEKEHTAMDIDHMRAEALPVDVPANLHALANPTRHYADDEYAGPHESAAEKFYTEQNEKMTPGKAMLLAVPLYLWNFAPHPFRPQEGESKAKWLMDIPFYLLLLVLELLGAVIKPFALCMRLFGNMVAGHVVLAVLILLIASAGPIVKQIAIGIPLGGLDLMISFLELFVAVLQAYIFTFLTTLFIASAVAPEH